jgi:hypothetical protein
MNGKNFEEHSSKYNISPLWHTEFKKEWTEEEITANIIKEIGYDIIRPARNYVYGKLYKMSNEGMTIHYAEETIIKDVLEQSVFKILAFGEDCFKDKESFPNGQRFYIGQWYKFSKYEYDKFKVGGEYVALLPDITLKAHVCDPYYVDHLFLTPYI